MPDRAARGLAGSTRARDARAGPGSGFTPHPHCAPRRTSSFADPALNYPDGHRLIELAREAWASGRRDDPWLLEPRYLRQSSAEEQWDARTSAAAPTEPPFTTDSSPGRIPCPRIDQSPHQVGLWIAVEPVPDHPARGRSRDLSQPDRALPPADLDGKVVLDAGCGMGRYLRIAAESSAGPDRRPRPEPRGRGRRELTAEQPDVAVVRGDLLRLPFAAGELRPDLLAGRSRPHARPPRGVPRAGAALEARRPHRHLGLPTRARRRRIDHERPARRLDPPAARPARAHFAGCPRPIGGLKRRLMASRWRLIERTGRRPAPGRPSASRCIPIPRSACATRSTGTPPVPVAAYVRRSCRLVPRRRTGRRGRPDPRPGSSFTKDRETASTSPARRPLGAAPSGT